jgi:hypothetical protein
MATAMTDTDCIAEIGTTAGEIWELLSENGAMTLARLARELEHPRDVVMQAVGWLAREGKLDIEATVRGRTVALRSSVS